MACVHAQAQTPGLGAQQEQDPEQEQQFEDSTIVYDAAYFADYSPVTVADMIDRIPGISLAMGGGRGGDRRGLGAGENEILINGQRQAGKSNEGRGQLSRISADQVDYIEIIRGTSDDLAIGGGAQIVNVVLRDSASRSSINVELNADYKQDDTYHPGAKLSWTGQTGDFNYLLALEAEPRYENVVANEVSRDADGLLLETRFEESVRDQTNYQATVNLGYTLGRHNLQLNGLYGEDSPPENKIRAINEFGGDAVTTRYERELTNRSRDNWEVGGDYEYGFDAGGIYRFLFIVNDQQFQSTRERFDVGINEDQKNLFLFSAGRDRERIARTSYTFDLAETHGLELGIEGAQTIRDDNLRLGVDDPQGTPSPQFGNLTPVEVGNANSTVEEIRIENFAVHNWQINDRMSLESSLVYELSTITQSGDVSRSRDFEFLRPKFDFRYDITNSLQFRGTVEKTVSQLSFRDFSASTDDDDEDRNVQAGNPDIRQEQSWDYSANLEYRLPDSIGVINTELFYHDITDVIDRIDVSTGPDNLQSARGNIGDAYRYGVNIDTSTRLGFLGLSDALLTTRLTVQDSEVTDPFTGETRRLRWNGRWFGRLSFRHDITAWNLSYGFNYAHSDNQSDARTQIDITDIEREIREYQLNLFLEKKAFNGVTFRFDVRDFNDPRRCRDRIRFVGATVDGIVEEVENYCSSEGPNYSVKISYTF